MLAYNNRGVAYTAKGDNDRAIADYNEAIRLDPKSRESLLNRGVAYRRQGRCDRAIADYNEAIRLDPKTPKAYNNRGARTSTRATTTEPSPITTRRSGSIPKTPRATTTGASLLRQGRLRPRHRRIRRGDPARSKYAHAYFNRGNAYRAKVNIDHAIADYSEAIRLDPNTPRLQQPGRAYQRQGRQ